MGTGPGAIAIFVKTPGRSPIKTRLAESIGKEAAEQFHVLSAQATAALAHACSALLRGALISYWAVAEPDELHNPLWRGQEVIAQGEGSLGERLHRVYAALLEKHRHVILMGADSPQVSVALIKSAVSAASVPGKSVLGPAEDGGFYLFGSAQALPQEVWTTVEYSVPTTAAQLQANLQTIAPVQLLPRHFDVDTVDELRRLDQALAREENILPEQLLLQAWLSDNLPP